MKERIIHIPDAESHLRRGQHWLQWLKEVGGLGKESRILEIGPGEGVLPIALDEGDEDFGLYVGMDVNQEFNKFCVEHVMPLSKKFHFVLVPVQNGQYSPGSPVSAKDYGFPFSDSSFDIVLLGSVFTHMLMGEVCNYLRQIRRVLGVGGRMIATAYLLDDESRRAIDSGLAERPFPCEYEGSWVQDPSHPNNAVAHDVKEFLKWLSHAGLSLIYPIQFGAWRNMRARGPTWLQDVVVAEKTNV